MIVAVLDTNVLISAFINPKGPPGQILEAFIDGRIQVCMTGHIWEEMQEVLARDKIWKIIVAKGDEQRVKDLCVELHDKLLAFAAEIPPGRNWVPGDRADNWIIQGALTAHADRIISGDRHLILLGQVENIPIVTPLQFLQEMQGAEGPKP